VSAWLLAGLVMQALALGLLMALYSGILLGWGPRTGGPSPFAAWLAAKPERDRKGYIVIGLVLAVSVLWAAGLAWALYPLAGFTFTAVAEAAAAVTLHRLHEQAERFRDEHQQV
jgi:hypothetical protein